MDLAKNKLTAEGFTVEKKTHIYKKSNGTQGSRDVLKIINGPENTKDGGIYKGISGILNNAQKKLGVEFYYDPTLILRDSLGNYGYEAAEGIGKISLSSAQLTRPNTVLNSTILHEVRHAHFRRQLMLGEPGFYYGKITSSNKQIGVKGYEKSISLEELGTNVAQLAQIRKNQVTLDGVVTERIRLAHPSYSDLDKVYDLISIRAKSIATEIENVSDEALYAIKDPKQVKFSPEYPGKATVRLDGKELDLSLVGVNKTTSQEEKMKILKQYLNDIKKNAQVQRDKIDQWDLESLY